MAKSIATCNKKNPYIINQNHIISKNYCEVISGWQRSQERVKKDVAASVFIKTIKYYENTNCTLKKGKKTSAQLSCVEVLHVNV